MLRIPALDAVEHLVSYPDVGERAADHDLVVSAAGAEAVKVSRLDTVSHEVLPCRAVLRYGARGGDVVGRIESPRSAGRMRP